MRSIPASKVAIWEQRIQDDHQLKHDSYTVRSIVDGQIVAQEVPALTAINMRFAG